MHAWFEANTMMLIVVEDKGEEELGAKQSENSHAEHRFTRQRKYTSEETGKMRVRETGTKHNPTVMNRNKKINFSSFKLF